MRAAEVKRATRETQVEGRLQLDGTVSRAEEVSKDNAKHADDG